MDKDKIKEEIEKVLVEQDVFKFMSVENVNYNPHPYMVGPRHIKHAADNHGGMLGEATMKAIPCAHKGCNFSYEEHTSESVCFMQLLRNCSGNEASEVLKDLQPILEEHKIDGFAFVETDQKYRIGDDGRGDD